MSDAANLTGSAHTTGTTTVERSASIATLTKDLALAQVEMKNPVKDVPNTFFKSLYADLAAVRDAVLPVLGKHKLAVLQMPTESTDGPALVTILSHESGEYIQTTMLLRAVKNDPQGVGSAMTYARRYALQSIAGVAAEADDDGNAASGHTNGNGAPARKQDVKPDAAIVDEDEAMLRNCKTAGELEAGRSILTLHKSKYTTDGAKHLAKVLKEMEAKYPAAK